MRKLLTKFFQRKDFVLLVVVSLLFLGYSFISSVPTRRSKQTQVTNSNVLANPKLKITFAPNFTLPSPKNIPPIFSAVSFSLPLEAAAASLAAQLGLDQTLPTTWLWQSVDSQQKLIANHLNKDLEYSLNYFTSEKDFTGPNKPTVESATQIAVEFSQLIKDIPALSPERVNIKYLLVGNSNFGSGSPEKFDLIQIDLSQVIDDLPVRLTNANNPALTVFVGQKNRIVKAVFYPEMVKTGPKLKTLLFIDQKQLSKFISGGQITQLGEYGPVIEPADLVSVEFQTATLEYRYSVTKNLLIPTYSFITQVITKNGLSAPANIILPAVDISKL